MNVEAGKLPSSQIEIEGRGNDENTATTRSTTDSVKDEIGSSGPNIDGRTAANSVMEQTHVSKRSVQEDHHNKPGSSNVKLDSATEEELEYESEPASVKSLENRRKKKLRSSLKESQGKTMYPLSRASAREFRELRELTRKHFMLEKNLKIEGIPEQPKVRKRRMSVGANFGRDKDVSYNKRKRLLSVDRPKKGHMPNWGSFGGDATDPLNLNGLAHSEEGRLLNLKTPENSPLPTPDFRKIVYVKVPPNIEDPLNLEGRHDQGYLNMLLNSKRKKKHRSKKNKDNVHQSKEERINLPDVDKSNDTNATINKGENMEVEEKSEPPSSQTPVKSKTEQSTTPQKQGAATRSRSRSISMSPDRKFKRQLSGVKSNKPIIDEPKKFPEKPMFTHGNYNRYYGYRNRDNEPDPRLKYFNPHLFENKDVLDIGCNVGHVTLAIAEHFHPRKILGMDIDGKLIQAARHNMRHMLSQRRKDSSKYPSVFELTRGPLEAHPLTGSSKTFPNNVLFLQGNYVPASEEILRLQREEYDTILALSITKWIHLNNGDYGLKLFFQKIASQLRPGGHLILEPQPYSTYKKRAKLAPDLFKNYSSIKLKPEGFKNYLLSIGFVKCEVIGVPITKAKGFRRPLLLFTKADRSSATSNQAPRSVPTCTECLGDQSECDHIQFTGMRRGAYADRLYDHISYRPSLRVQEINNSSSNPFMPLPDSPVVDMPYEAYSSPHYTLNSAYAANSSAHGSGTSHRSVSSQSYTSSSSSGSLSSSYSSESSGSGSSFTEDSSPIPVQVNGGDGDNIPAGLVGEAPDLNDANGHNGGGLNGDIDNDMDAQHGWVEEVVNNNAVGDIPLQLENNIDIQNNVLPINGDDSTSSELVDQQDQDAIG